MSEPTDPDERRRFLSEYQQGWCPSPAEVGEHVTNCVLPDHHEGDHEPDKRWEAKHDCVRMGCAQYRMRRRRGMQPQRLPAPQP